MFLKKEDFPYNGESVVLYELSGLQRIEYMEFISEKTKPFENMAEADSSSNRNAEFYRITIEINAWLVSRSLWNADNKQDVEKLFESTMLSWSSDALELGANKVIELSGMNVKSDNTAAAYPEEIGDVAAEKR